MGTIEPPSDGEHKTLCGKKWPGDPGKKEECDHLDCAIWVTEEGFKRYGRLSLFIIAFGVLLGIFWYDFRWFGILEIALGISFGLPSLHYHQKRLELIEFRDHGTIGGIRACKL